MSFPTYLHNPLSIVQGWIHVFTTIALKNKAASKHRDDTPFCRPILNGKWKILAICHLPFAIVHFRQAG
jgi:hypothetical protein